MTKLAALVTGGVIVACAFAPAAQARSRPGWVWQFDHIRTVISWNGPSCINAWAGGHGPFRSGRWIGIDR